MTSVPLTSKSSPPAKISNMASGGDHCRKPTANRLRKLPGGQARPELTCRRQPNLASQFLGQHHPGSLLSRFIVGCGRPRRVLRSSARKLTSCRDMCPEVVEVVLRKNYRFMYENFVIATQGDLYLLLEKSGGMVDALKFDFSIFKYGSPNDEVAGATRYPSAAWAFTGCSR